MSNCGLWYQTEAGSLSRMALSDVVRISSFPRPAVDDVDDTVAEEAAAPRVVPVSREGDACAVLLVPSAAESRALVNGSAAPSGMHLLRHGDRVDVSEKTLWVSAGAAPEETRYDPQTHGEDVFCFRTKARLEPGEPIVICPGTSKTTCGMIYKASAWELGIPCHNCRFDPSKPAWHPPAPKTRSHLDEFFALASQ